MLELRDDLSLRVRKYAVNVQLPSRLSQKSVHAALEDAFVNGIFQLWR